MEDFDKMIVKSRNMPYDKKKATKVVQRSYDGLRDRLCMHIYGQLDLKKL